MASTMLHEKCCNTVLQIGAPVIVLADGEVTFVGLLIGRKLRRNYVILG